MCLISSCCVGCQLPWGRARRQGAARLHAVRGRHARPGAHLLLSLAVYRFCVVSDARIPLISASWPFKIKDISASVILNLVSHMLSLFCYNNFVSYSFKHVSRVVMFIWFYACFDRTKFRITLAERTLSPVLDLRLTE